MLTTRQPAVSRGDVVEVTGRRVGEPARIGEILDVLGSEGHRHYRVCWEDGHESILYPGEATGIRPRATRRHLSLDLAAVTASLVDAIRATGAEFEVVPHRRTTTAAGEARALGLLPQDVAKTVIARAPDGTVVRAVVPASTKVDVPKLAAAVSEPSLEVLHEADLVTVYPQFELGAVPPFGGPAGDSVVVDSALAEAEHVVFDAGVHDTAIRIRGEDLVAVAHAATADIAVREE
jgi:Ala-tRNA(Pro) deacylase